MRHSVISPISSSMNAVFERISELERLESSFEKPIPFQDFFKEAPQTAKEPTNKNQAVGPTQPQASLLSEQQLPSSKKDLVQLSEKVAREVGLNPSLLNALIEQESGFNENAVSPKGALGLTQLMPDTAKLLGVENPLDPEENIRGGAKFLKEMLTQFGTVDKALAAYNAGPGAVRKFNGVPPYSETKNYVKTIGTKFATYVE